MVASISLKVAKDSWGSYSSVKYFSVEKKTEVYAFVPIDRDAKSCTFCLANVRNEWQKNASCLF